MTHCKLVAGEVAGTYHVTEAVTEGELLQIVKRLARRRLARGRKITQPALAFEYLQVHNHPSGDPEPSAADRRITARL